MARNLFLLFFFAFIRVYSDSSRDSIFSGLSFGKGRTVIYIGSGALKRHLDLNLLDSDVKAYYKTPAFILASDHSIYPYASNAYLGLGPFISGWVARKDFTRDNQFVQSTFYNILIAAKLTHHTTYFVRKKLDIFTAYIVGVHINRYHNYKVDGVNAPLPKTSFLPAIGISATIRYYFSKKTGVYGEVGLGYKINILNIGLCYKLTKKSR